MMPLNVRLSAYFSRYRASLPQFSAPKLHGNNCVQD
jgi:hypothetical protein